MCKILNKYYLYALVSTILVVGVFVIYNNTDKEMIKTEDVNNIVYSYIEENCKEIEYTSISKLFEGIYTYDSYEKELADLLGPVSFKYKQCYICLYTLSNADNESLACIRLYVDKSTGKIKYSYIETTKPGYTR